MKFSELQGVRSMVSGKRFLSILSICGLFLLPFSSKAQTIVNVETGLGNFSIELFDSTAPATVANFLSYVNSGRYNGTFMHRSVPGFVLQGGGFIYNESTNQAPPIALDPPVVNEFGVSNTRGTVAMAKVGGDPDSATSQWFVNLADNGANLDAQNGGFTVFGRIIDPGMTVVDSIANLPLANLGGAFSAVPLVNFNGTALFANNFISVQMSVSAPPTPVISNSFDQATNRLNLKVSLDGNEFVAVSFVAEATAPQAIIRGLPETATPLTAGDASFATFTAADGVLLIPQLFINGEVAFRNARFVLTDAAQFRFTLQSVE
ncbi:MAG: peptidylprolyl isomerase [Pseudohongiellaceae bacterium]